MLLQRWKHEAKCGGHGIPAILIGIAFILKNQNNGTDNQ
jgi:hypothetical protein